MKQLKLLKLPVVVVVTVLTIPQASADDIEEIIVSASPHNKSAEQVAGSFNLIEGEELQREAAATLGDTLKNQVGIASASFGPGVGNPLIRGLGGKRIEVLQNSMSVADASDISPDHGVASEALLAERIEILRGPATLRYGPGTIGGVINIIDNRIHTQVFDGLEGAVEVRHNSANEGNALVARVDAGNGPLTLHLDGVSRKSNYIEIPGLAARLADNSDETTNGFIANSDTEANAFAFGLSRVTDNSIIGFGVNRLDNNYGLPPGSHEHEEEEADSHEHEEEEADPDVRIDMQQTGYQGKLQLVKLAGFYHQLNIDGSYTQYRHRELEIERGITQVGSVIESDSIELHAELISGKATEPLSALGYQYTSRDFDTAGDEAFVPPSKTVGHGIYWLYERPLNRVEDATFEMSLRFDHQQIDLNQSAQHFNHNSLNLSTSLLLPLGDKNRIGLILSRTQRAPAAEELLSNGVHVATNAHETGNPNLNNESAINAELTWVYQGVITLRGSIYHNRFDGFIYQRDTGLRFSEDFGQCSDNLDHFDNEPAHFQDSMGCFEFARQDAKFTGMELESEWVLSDRQTLALQADIVRGTLHGNIDVPRLPPARIMAGWIIENDAWRYAVNLSKVAAQNRAGENQPKTSGYTKLDMSLSYVQENWSVFLKGRNLTDSEIRNSSSSLRDIAPEAGRNFVFGARYRF